ncbi:hypothetical protein NL676_000659 [Syzygium grande]|nr:hypothetical protein NL676_000659 [Syzygium grande]
MQYTLSSTGYKMSIISAPSSAFSNTLNQRGTPITILFICRNAILFPRQNLRPALNTGLLFLLVMESKTVRDLVDSSKMSCTLMFLYNYNGRIALCKSDSKLYHVSGFTRILLVDHSISLFVCF